MICLIVLKKTLLKVNIYYDYIAKTSQDIAESYNKTFSLNAYELSENGRCPQFCSQCNELSQCIKCKNEYGVYEIKNGGIINRYCKLISELKGYYLSDGVYYQCMENCDECEM